MHHVQCPILADERPERAAKWSVEPTGERVGGRTGAPVMEQVCERSGRRVARWVGAGWKRVGNPFRNLFRKAAGTGPTIRPKRCVPGFARGVPRVHHGRHGSFATVLPRSGSSPPSQAVEDDPRSPPRRGSSHVRDRIRSPQGLLRTVRPDGGSVGGPGVEASSDARRAASHWHSGATPPLPQQPCPGRPASTPRRRYQPQG